MPELSIRDAAKACGVGKTTILRAIQSGRMSAPRKDDGGYAIDPAELFRVFPPKSLLEGPLDHTGTRPMGQDASPPGPPGTDLVSSRLAALETELHGLKELVRRLDLDKQDLKSDRDAWKGQAESAQRLLSVASSPSHPSPDPSRSGLFGWLKRSSKAA